MGKKEVGRRRRNGQLSKGESVINCLMTRRRYSEKESVVTDVV
jgi:hypothetical protein